MDNIFFIVGGQRCGTTYLYKILDDHPEICMAKPMKPEPKFFFYDDEYKKGINYYEKKYFSHCNREIIWGEKSTSYMERAMVPKRMKESYPDCKIIIVLRNPVHRALSNYFFSKKNGLETRTLEEVFIEKKSPPTVSQKISVSPFDYLERGMYKQYIQNYYKYFDRNQVKILLFEKFIANTQKIKNLFIFLNVFPTFIPEEINRKYNVSIYKDISIDKKVIRELSNSYAKSISELENYLKMDLGCWRI